MIQIRCFDFSTGGDKATKGQTMYHELEEIQEIFFQEKGMIDIGYEINKMERFVIRLSKGAVVGAYNCCFEKRSLFLYKCKTDVRGYILRKESWGEILEENGEIADILKESVRIDYNQIKLKVNAVKRSYVNMLSKRAGQAQCLTITNKK